MTFSLVVSTLGRSKEVGELFESLCRQTFQDFKVILVDQNSDGRLHPIVQAFEQRLSIEHLTSPKGVSIGRNRGLANSGGSDIVAFPDDDCIYPADLLERVAKLFTDHPDWAGLSGRSVTLEGNDSNGRWHHEPGRILLNNVFNRTTTFTIFLRTSAMAGIRFDETLGPGPTPANKFYGGGEDLDLALQLIGRGDYLSFDPTIHVHHPEWTMTGYDDAVCQKALSYGRGMGRLMRKHHFPLYLVAYHLVRPFGGTVIAMLKGKFAKARWHWAMCAGRFDGWATTPEQLSGRNPIAQPGFEKR